MDMTVFSRAAFYGAVMVLVGCTTYNHVVEQAHTLHVCRLACAQQIKVCGDVCHNDDRDCEISAKNSTTKHYCEYKHEQYVKGGVVARELKSYRDPLQCRKITCDCWADYRVCMESCTGTIHKRLQAAPVT